MSQTFKKQQIHPEFFHRIVVQNKVAATRQQSWLSTCQKAGGSIYVFSSLHVKKSFGKNLNPTLLLMNI